MQATSLPFIVRATSVGLGAATSFHGGPERLAAPHRAGLLSVARLPGVSLLLGLRRTPTGGAAFRGPTEGERVAAHPAREARVQRVVLEPGRDTRW